MAATMRFKPGDRARIVDVGRDKGSIVDHTHYRSLKNELVEIINLTDTETAYTICVLRTKYVTTCYDWRLEPIAILETPEEFLKSRDCKNLSLWLRS